MERKRQVDTKASPTRTLPDTTSGGDSAPRKPGARAGLSRTTGRAYERFLELPVVIVLAVMWLVGAALLGSIVLVLYSTGWALLRLATGAA